MESAKIGPETSVTINTTSQVFEARFVGPAGNKGWPMILEVDSNGLRLKTKKNGTVFSNLKWGEMRELQNQLREKGWFAYYGNFYSLNFKGTKTIGQGTGKIRLALEGDRAQWEKVAVIFDQLPPEAGARKCAACSGPVIDGVCRNCGKSFRAVHRQRGMKLIGLGIALGALGAILTAAFSSGNKVILFIGLILMGLTLIIMGAIGLIFGARVS